jgi:hypothetical protein
MKPKQPPLAPTTLVHASSSVTLHNEPPTVEMIQRLCNMAHQNILNDAWRGLCSCVAGGVVVRAGVMLRSRERINLIRHLVQGTSPGTEFRLNRLRNIAWRRQRQCFAGRLLASAVLDQSPQRYHEHWGMTQAQNLRKTLQFTEGALQTSKCVAHVFGQRRTTMRRTPNFPRAVTIRSRGARGWRAGAGRRRSAHSGSVTPKFSRIFGGDTSPNLIPQFLANKQTSRLLSGQRRTTMRSMPNFSSS